MAAGAGAGELAEGVSGGAGGELLLQLVEASDRTGSLEAVWLRDGAVDLRLLLLRRWERVRGRDLGTRVWLLLGGLVTAGGWLERREGGILRHVFNQKINK